MKSLVDHHSHGRAAASSSSLFGLRLWVVIVFGIVLLICIALLVLWLVKFAWTSCRTGYPLRTNNGKHNNNQDKIPHVVPTIVRCEEVNHISVDQQGTSIITMQIKDAEVNHNNADQGCTSVQCQGQGTGSDSASVSDPSSGAALGSAPSPGSQLGMGHSWFTLRDLELATDSFSHHNILGQGVYGVVYRGKLPQSASTSYDIAVKKLLNNFRGQAEKEFQVEVDAIGKVRHKNLVRLIGFCVEDTHRMLVYEYVDNGNLEQWLHGQRNSMSIPWAGRMKIALGTAKGLAYLHEGLEPKVVHRDVKSSNILLDTQWNPKISDFGLAKLLGADKSFVTTRVMGTFGYVAPEYANSGLLNERSDVYSFGVLLMEIITGRRPIYRSESHGQEINLVDWLKTMVASRRSEEVLDPRLDIKPSSRALKRALLVALRCVDPDAQKRPKIGHVVQILDELEGYQNRDHCWGRMIGKPSHEVVTTGGQEISTFRKCGSYLRSLST